MSFEILEDRCLLAADFGDAPDTGHGTARGNYQTLLSDNGPRHTIVAGLRMGASVDGYDGGVLQNAAANADDINGALPKDEDGLANPAVDLSLTAGTVPTVNVWVTNTTPTSATVYGWIDYNADGVFDNATERGSVAVPAGTSSKIFTITFPTVPSGFTGTTYARFRLSTDPAAANSTGAAADGEVEDYPATITELSSGIVASSKSTKIGAGGAGEPTLARYAWFGGAVAPLGDMDGDGVPDIVVGSRDSDWVHGIARGELYVTFLNADGGVKSYRRITDGVNGGPALPDSNYFGESIASIGDLDGNGVSDLVVGDDLDSTGGPNRGAVYVLFMSADGTVQSSQKIASGIGGAPAIADFGGFGRSVAALGDLNGDGVNDILVGASGDPTGGRGRGAAYVLMLNADGTVKSSQKIASGTGGGPALADFDDFGSSVCALGDLDSDGITDIAVGAPGNFGNSGAAYVVFLNADGTAKRWSKIADGAAGSLHLDRNDSFGASIAALNDLDGDGVNDLAVGATGDDTGVRGFSNYGGPGAVHILFLNADGTAKGLQTIASRIGGGPLIPNDAYFGGSVASLGDLDGDGVLDLAVGAPDDRSVGHGIVHVLHFEQQNDFAPQFTSSTTISVAENAAAVMTVTATDADLPVQPLSFSIVGGADRGAFEITSGGALSFRWPRDFEVPTDANRDNVYEVMVQVSDGNSGVAMQRIQVSITDVADSPSVDFGDAPDATPGTGWHNYQTMLTDNGPRHTILAGLRIGAYVDGDSGALQGAAANADDMNGSLPNDEDGLISPVAGIVVTIGAAPSTEVRVTNTTGTPATLYGWIDYDGDGTFENSTERASVIVPDGTDNSAVTLLFPKVPSGFTGTTYARFRLSTDAAAAQPIGPATDGEVEDYIATILAPNTGRIDSTKTVRITNSTNGGPALAVGDRFGRAVISLGDLDGDGVVDLAVGADQYDSYGQGGAVYVLFMNSNGTVKSSRKIGSEVAGGPILDNSTFGTSLASLGDLDGDGIIDIVVGDSTDSFNGRDCGAVYVLFLNADGTVKHSQRIASDVSGGPQLTDYDQMGHSVAAIGDLDGDGVTEIAVGTPGDSSGNDESGAVYVLFLNTDGTAKRSQMIGNQIGGGPTLFWESLFGTGVAALGDFDGDGVNDLLVGARGDDGTDTHRGSAYIVLLNSDGTAKSSQRISEGPPLSDYDGFGTCVATLGDMDGDGITDIAVSASGDDTGGRDRGAIYVLMLNADGGVKSRWKIAENTNGGPTLPNYGKLGRGIAPLGDIDGDGIIDLAVGASGGYEYDGGDPYGSVYVVFLKPQTADYGDAPDIALGSGPGNYQTLAIDDGPSHVIVDGLRLGASVDGDSGSLQNAAAIADNADGTLPSDEDGLVNPVSDLQLTSGTVPTISLWVTNTTGATATLFGWIDYNGNGVFENATERASIMVPDGTESQIVTLSFPVVPVIHANTTYARFRLSTDTAAANPTGPATDGEVEDYRVQITVPSSGLVDSAKTEKLARNLNGVPNEDIYIGGAIASVGDLDGDGVTDLVIGSGYTLFMNPNGTVKRAQALGKDLDGEYIAALGDLDGDGRTDIAMTGVSYHSGYWYTYISVVHMNADGTGKRSGLVTDALGPMSMAGVGDLDGDGVGDLAVGVETERQFGEYDSGAVYTFLLNPDGSIKAYQVIATEIGGGPKLGEGDLFGSAITSLGDIDGDGIPDMAVTATGDKTGSSNDYTRMGAVYIVLMNDDGTAKSTHKIAHQTGGGPTLDQYSHFGASVATLGDIDGDGITDIAVGAIYDKTGGNGRGAIYEIMLNADGTAKRTVKIADATNGGPALADWDRFGSSIASLGDLNGDGVTDIAVVASDDDTGRSDNGAIYVLFLQPQSLPGDYNLDNVVDLADYVLWRKTLNTEVPKSSGAEGNGNGIVDNDDYAIWRANMGRSLPAPPLPSGNGAIRMGSATATNAAPEIVVPTAEPSSLIGDDAPARLSRVFTTATPNTPKLPSGNIESSRDEVAASAASTDEALLSLLWTLSERPFAKPVISDFDDLPAEAAPPISPLPTADPLELAFASLAPWN